MQREDPQLEYRARNSSLGRSECIPADRLSQVGLLLMSIQKSRRSKRDRLHHFQPGSHRQTMSRRLSLRFNFALVLSLGLVALANTTDAQYAGELLQHQKISRRAGNGPSVRDLDQFGRGMDIIGDVNGDDVVGSLSVLSGSPVLGSTMVLGLVNPLATQTPGSLGIVLFAFGPTPIPPVGRPWS
ncbi:MAG: hypothetical protein ACI8PQ_000366 [Planctomycetota bacterium]|jgi:hypothetical protein